MGLRLFFIRALVAALLVEPACSLNTYGLSEASGQSNDATSSGTPPGTDSGSSGPTTSTAGTTDTSGTNASPTSETTGGAIPEAPALTIGFSQIKRFDFTWTPSADADVYQLHEQPGADTLFAQIGVDLLGAADSATIVVPLHFRPNAGYFLRACNDAGCSDSNILTIEDTLAKAIGYFKATNAEAGDEFGARLTLSADGKTLAVSARSEASGAVADQNDNSAAGAGAVYVFVRQGDEWSHQAYLKSSNVEAGDGFGRSLTLSGDGNILAVGAPNEDSNGTEQDNSVTAAGAVYVYTRQGNLWSQTAYLKASNLGPGDVFGGYVDLSVDGHTLAIAAAGEDSGDGNQEDNSAPQSGAAYVFVQSNENWSQQAYFKAANITQGDVFGSPLVLSADGNTLAIGAPGEDSKATGIDGDGTDNSLGDSGAVYVFVRADGVWSQQAYVKANQPDPIDHFGYSVTLSGDGNTLAVGSDAEDSQFAGINVPDTDDNLKDAGSVHVFTRTGDDWSQEAYIKASNPGASDYFGENVALSADGNVLAVCANSEDGGNVGVNSGEEDESVVGAGAAYVFTRNAGTWAQSAYLKAPNPDTLDEFGISIALSSDGDTVVVGAVGEASDSREIGGNQSNNSAPRAGAVYMF